MEEGESASRHSSAAPQHAVLDEALVAKELEMLRKQRTEMLGASESCLKIQKKFKMPSRLLTACALNNEAVYLVEDQEDFAKARDCYAQCVSLVETELKDINHTHLPLMVKRMQNFSEHIRGQMVKLEQAEADGHYNSCPVLEED